MLASKALLLGRIPGSLVKKNSIFLTMIAK
jgi:hypothetical protein